MKKSDIYEVAVKVLGLYLVFNVLGQLRELSFYIFAFLQSLNYPESASSNQMPLFLIGILGFVLLVVAAWFVLFKSSYIVSKICKPADFEENATLFIERNVVYEIAITLLGLMVIISALPEFVTMLNMYIHELTGGGFSSSNKNFLVISGVKVLVGALALLFARSISSALTRK